MDPRAIASRVLVSRPAVFGKSVLDVYGAAAGGLLANGLAYAALFAALPTTLLMLGIAGFVTSDPAFEQELAARLATAFPPLRELIDDALRAVSSGAGVSSILGFIGLVWAVSQFYGTLDTAFARIFSGAPERGFAGRTLRGFLWVLALVGLVVGALVVTTLASSIDALLPGRVPNARTIADVTTSPLATLLLAMVVVGVGYRVLPVRAPRWRSLIGPAIIVGMAITLLTQAFGLLVPVLVRAASVAGSVAVAFIALAWLSFVFQAVLLGAAWVKVSEDRGTG
jgi:YihY family inner membrane protein